MKVSLPDTSLLGGGRLGRRLLTWILLGTVIFTVLGTVVQLTIDYRRDLGALSAQLDQIQTSRVSSLTNSLWHLDEAQVLSQLDGILASTSSSF